MNTEGIDSKNNEAFLEIIKKFWGFDDESYAFIKARLETDQFDSEYSKLLAGSKDQRIRWDIDFLEPALAKYYSENDSAYKMFMRKFGNIINRLREKEYIAIDYTAFMNNRIVYKKNETKLKKVFEAAYLEDPRYFRADASVRDGVEITPEIVSKYIVTSFEQIGTTKKPLKKLQLVLSLNMCDWLLASTGGEISSCLNLEGGNRYWSGLPFLAGDTNRAMLYITDGIKKEYEGITVDNAMTRSWVILTKDNKKSLVRWFMSEIIKDEAINNIVGGNDFQMGMKSSGKNEIIPLHLSSGLTTTIYMDAGCWEPNKDYTKFIHTMSFKGCYQLFSEDLKPIRDVSFTRPFGGGDVSWRISHFKSIGMAIDDCVPVTRCKSCGKKKMFSKSSNGICVSCFNKKYFLCPICGEPHELKEKFYEGLIIKNDRRVQEKICLRCYKNLKVCECCGIPIANDSHMNQTVDGSVICNECLENKLNGYKRCSSCSKISKTKVFSYYNKEERTFAEYCQEHLPKQKDEIEKFSSSSVIFTRKPFKNIECPQCHSRLPEESFIGKACITCSMSNNEMEAMEL